MNVNEILSTLKKVVNKQDKNDSRLLTNSKDIVGAINENKSSLEEMKSRLNKTTLNILDYIEKGYSDTESFKMAITELITRGGGSLIVPRIERDYEITEELTFYASGDVNISIKGYGMPIIKFVNGGNGIVFKSSKIPLIVYSDRLMWVNIEDIFIRGKKGSNTGNGIDINGFGFVTMKNVQSYNFNKCINIQDGSEIIMENVRGAGGNIGLYAIRTNSSPQNDLANATLIGCNFHNNSVASVILDGVRQVNFQGGSLIGANSSSKDAVIRSTQNAVDYVLFEGVNFENNPTNPSLIIGDDNDNYNITLIDIIGCQFATKSPNAIQVNKCSILNFFFNSTATNIKPFITFGSNLSKNFKFNCDGNFPYFNEYNIKDLRSELTEFNLHKENIVNAFNTDFSKSYYGYNCNKAPLFNESSLTGKGEIMFSNGSNNYLSINFYNNNEKITLSENKELLIECIVKYENPNAIFFAVTTDKDGRNTSVNIIPQQFVIQEIGDYKRVVTKYIVPENKLLTSIRITNETNLSSDLTIDNLKISSKDIPVNNDIYVSFKPNQGIFEKGNRVKNLDISVGKPLEYVCVESPLIFKDINILS